MLSTFRFTAEGEGGGTLLPQPLIHLPSQVPPCQCPHYTFCLPLNMTHAGAKFMMQNAPMGECFPGQWQSADCFRFSRHRTEPRGRNGSGLWERPVHLAPGLLDSWSGAVGTLTWLRNRSAEQEC